MNIIPISEFRNNISDYINKVIYNKENIFIKKGKFVVAKVVPAKTPTRSIIELAGLLTKDEAKKMKKELAKIKKLDNDPLGHFRSH